MSMKPSLVCLCGGFGTRFREVSTLPKILAPIFSENIPALEIIVKWAEKSGFGHIFFLTGHNSNFIQDFLNNHSFTIGITVLNEGPPKGTAAAILKFKNHLPDEFYVSNGDTIFSALLELSETPTLATIFGCYKSDGSRYGALRLRGNSIVAFEEKSIKKIPGYVSSGVVYLRQTDFNELVGNSLEFDMYPNLASRHLLSFEQFRSNFLDYGTLNAFRETKTMSVKKFIRY